MSFWQYVKAKIFFWRQPKATVQEETTGYRSGVLPRRRERRNSRDDSKMAEVVVEKVNIYDMLEPSKKTNLSINVESTEYNTPTPATDSGSTSDEFLREYMQQREKFNLEATAKFSSADFLFGDEKVNEQKDSSDTPSYQRGTTPSSDAGTVPTTSFRTGGRSYAEESKEAKQYYSRLGQKVEMSNRPPPSPVNPNPAPEVSGEKKESPTRRASAAASEASTEGKKAASSAASASEAEGEEKGLKKSAHSYRDSGLREENRDFSEKAKRDREMRAKAKAEEERREKERKERKERERKKEGSGYFWHEKNYYFYDGKYKVYWWWDPVNKKYLRCADEETQKDKKTKGSKEQKNPSPQREKLDQTRTAAAFMTSDEDASDEQSEVNRIIINLMQALKSAEGKGSGERKKIYRKLCLEWHPDKHSVDKRFVATCAFQYLQEKKEWILAEG